MALDPTLEYFIPLPELDTTLNIEPGAYHQIEHDIRRVDALLPNSEAVSNEAIGAHGALCTTPRQDSGENTGPSQAQRTNLIPMERFLSACSVVDDPSLWRYHCSGLVRRPSPYTVPGRPSQSSECGEETSAPSTIHPTITKTDGTESASQVSSAPTSND
ncbi:hypothetical protein DRE_00180 [Drechslerella stenobrocha 248]|uniref:Uncharacterized protein n=1 Tax=Drechslerella stenobrocha 248 TaxID=1043628 RepID=W7IHV8_9PEZI|nr:hypothetical protein DRE_00180 [Drechslerella stenobrocha 248]